MKPAYPQAGANDQPHFFRASNRTPVTHSLHSRRSVHQSTNQPPNVTSILKMATAQQQPLTEYVTLVSSDGYSFILRRSAACISPAIKRMLDPASACYPQAPNERQLTRLARQLH